MIYYFEWPVVDSLYSNRMLVDVSLDQMIRTAVRE